MSTDSATWRCIRQDLESLPGGDWSLMWTSRAPMAFFVPIQLQRQWTWLRPTDESLRARASAIFVKAAKARGYGNEDQWLDELRHAEFVTFRISEDAREKLPDGTFQERESGVLRDVVKHSITLCHQFETGDVPKPIALRLSSEAIAKMDAATAAFLANFLPKLEREATKLEDRPDRRIREAELLRELVIQHYEVAAPECMHLCASVAEFETELRAGIARFVQFRVRQYRWLSDAMRSELDAGFAFFTMSANPLAGITEAEKNSEWHVGAITGEALANVALKLVAEAAAHATGDGFAKLERLEARLSSEAEQVRSEEPAAENGRQRKAFVLPILKSKGWSILDWASNSDVDYHTANDYLKGVTNPYASTRKKLADALVVDVQSLPK